MRTDVRVKIGNMATELEALGKTCLAEGDHASAGAALAAAAWLGTFRALDRGQTPGMFAEVAPKDDAPAPRKKKPSRSAQPAAAPSSPPPAPAAAIDDDDDDDDVDPPPSAPERD